MKLNLPNQITLARLGLSVVFMAVLSCYSQREPQPLLLDISTALFVVAALTDFVDGYLARKWGQVTPLGRVLDPVADKVLVCGAFVLFAGSGFVDESGTNVSGVAPWMVVVILGRELLVTTIRGYQESVGLSFAASLHGKIKMWVQSITAPALLVLIAHEGTWFDPQVARWLRVALVWITVVATALSLGQYLVRAKRILVESAPS